MRYVFLFLAGLDVPCNAEKNMLLQSLLQQRHKIVDIQIIFLSYFIYSCFMKRRSQQLRLHRVIRPLGKTGEQQNKNDVSGSEREILRPGIRPARLTRTTKNSKAAGQNSNLGPPAQETGGLSTQPRRSVKNIQPNDRQVRRRRWTSGFQDAVSFVASWTSYALKNIGELLTGSSTDTRKNSHISVAGGCTDCEQHTTASEYRTPLAAVTCELGSLMIRDKPTNRNPRQVPLAFFLVTGRI